MHYEIDVPLEQLIMPLKLKHKNDRYVNIVNVVLFTKNTIRIFPIGISLIRRD